MTRGWIPVNQMEKNVNEHCLTFRWLVHHLLQRIRLLFLFQEMVDVILWMYSPTEGETEDWLLVFSDSVKFFYTHLKRVL